MKFIILFILLIIFFACDENKENQVIQPERETEFYFNSIPKKYGNMWDYDFKCIRKLKSTGEEILNFEGNAKVRHFRNDLFHCFNEYNEWICKE